MNLTDFIKYGAIRPVATATVATVATHGQEKPSSVARVATVAVANLAKPDADTAANDPGDLADLAPDRGCWPVTEAWNTAEIAKFDRRLERFIDRGLTVAEAEMLADATIFRDRDVFDRRRACMECAHLRGRQCGNSGKAGVTRQPLPLAFIVRFQRCEGFGDGAA